MALKLNGTNSEAAPAYAGDDADTGLQCGTNELKLVTGGSARATVDSAGRVLVGTSSTPATCTSVFAGRSDGATDPVLRLEVNSTAPANGAALGGLNFASSGLSGFQAGARIAAVRDGGTWTNGSSHPTYFEFATTANGASSPTERLRITSDGTLKLASGCPGIDFSGIQTNASGMSSETLDSYEEGSWTPTLAWGSTLATLHSDTAGAYTKIGNTVFINFQIRQTARNTPSGNASIGSLPFNENSHTSYNHGMIQGNSGISLPSNAGSIMLYINNGSIRLLYQTNTGHGDMTSSQCADDTFFYGFGVYHTSS